MDILAHWDSAQGLHKEPNPHVTITHTTIPFALGPREHTFPAAKISMPLLHLTHWTSQRHLFESVTAPPTLESVWL
jgi:hypothetical protein